MKDSEVNRIVAEFMGYSAKYIDSGIIRQEIDMGDSGWEYIQHRLFTESLDSLVPVWEILENNKTRYDELVMDFNKMRYGCGFWFSELHESQEDTCHYMSVGHKTIQQAAAHATAKAILELKND